MAGDAAATAGSCSSSKRYIPVVRSILSRGPWAMSLPRVTVTSSPITTELALTSNVAQSPVAVCPSLDVTSTFCLASMRVSCDGALLPASSPLDSPSPAWPV